MSKKLVTFNGGHPLKLDDLNTIQDRLYEFMEALFKPFADTLPDSFILYGCEVVVNGSNYDVSEGWVVLDGEVLSVAAHSVPVNPAQTFYWGLSVITGNPSVYQNAMTHDVIENRFVTLVGSATPPASYMPLDAPSYKNIIHGEWKEYEPVQYDSDLSTNVFTPDNTNLIMYRISGKTLHMVIRLSGDVLTSSNIIKFALPASATTVILYGTRLPAIIFRAGSDEPGRVIFGSTFSLTQSEIGLTLIDSVVGTGYTSLQAQVSIPLQ